MVGLVFHIFSLEVHRSKLLKNTQWIQNVLYLLSVICDICDFRQGYEQKTEKEMTLGNFLSIFATMIAFDKVMDNGTMLFYLLVFTHKD